MFSKKICLRKRGCHQARCGWCSVITFPSDNSRTSGRSTAASRHHQLLPRFVGARDCPTPPFHRAQPSQKEVEVRFRGLEAILRRVEAVVDPARDGGVPASMGELCCSLAGKRPTRSFPIRRDDSRQEDLGPMTLPTRSNPIEVTIVVPVRNEARNIEAFLGAHRWAAELIVVDNGSDDDTMARASAAGARVLSCPEVTIGEARNAGIAAATYAWVLSLDADEVAEPELAEELRVLLSAPRFEAYQIRRRNRYLGREQTRGSWGHEWLVRLARREHRYDSVLVHEQLHAPRPHGTLHAALWHEPYRDLSHHIAKMDRYARWGAEMLYARGRRASVVDCTVRPMWRFLKSYVVSGQCLDGRFGLITSLLNAQTAFLKYAHLWALERERS